MSSMSDSTAVEAMTAPSGETGAENDGSATHGDANMSSSESEDSPNIENGRKVISHLFGRNKICTRQIPERFFVICPRKMYQRTRSSAPSEWAFEQLKLLRSQVNEMEEWGQVRSWAIELKASQRQQIKQENAESARSATLNRNSQPQQSETRCAERFLVPYLGRGKSFGYINGVIDMIEADLKRRAEDERKFPGVEFLPDIDIELYPPRPMNVSRLPRGTRGLVKEWLKEKRQFQGRAVKQ